MSTEQKEYLPEGSTGRVRKHITVPPIVAQWLDAEIDNQSELITDLLLAYRAFGDYQEAVEYINEKRARERAAEKEQ